jgi:amidase
MHDPFGAFIKNDDIRIPGAATGPLRGLTFAAKDNFDIKGHVTGAGNPDWLRTHEAAASTAPAVQLLLDAGATLVGKTIMDELAFSLNGENIQYGTPVNPAAPERIPGGSSSGSASATAGRLVDFALGADTSGSVRVPASYCGLFGIRATHGAIPTEGVVPLAPGFDTVGWFAREADLLFRVGQVLLPTQSAPQLPTRILIADDAFALAEAPVQAILQTEIEKLAEFTQSITHTRLSETSLEIWTEIEVTCKTYEVWQAHGEWIRSVKPKFAAEIEKRFLRASTVTAAQKKEAEIRRSAIRSRLLELLRDDTVICLPTTPGIAPLKNAAPASTEQTRVRTLALSCIAGLAGAPQITLPLAAFEGCPVGLSLMVAPGKDMILLHFATRLLSQG